MAEYCISCCSTADLTKEYFDKRGIRYVCFHYELGGTDYLDDLGQTMPPAELYRRMLAGEDVKTSQVSIGEYADFFRKIFVICFIVCYNSIALYCEGKNCYLLRQ